MGAPEHHQHEEHGRPAGATTAAEAPRSATAGHATSPTTTEGRDPMEGGGRAGARLLVRPCPPCSAAAAAYVDTRSAAAPNHAQPRSEMYAAARVERCSGEDPGRTATADQRVRRGHGCRRAPQATVAHVWKGYDLPHVQGVVQPVTANIAQARMPGPPFPGSASKAVVKLIAKQHRPAFFQRGLAEVIVKHQDQLTWRSQRRFVTSMEHVLEHQCVPRDVRSRHGRSTGRKASTSSAREGTHQRSPAPTMQEPWPRPRVVIFSNTRHVAIPELPIASRVRLTTSWTRWQDAPASVSTPPQSGVEDSLHKSSADPPPSRRCRRTFSADAEHPLAAKVCADW